MRRVTGVKIRSRILVSITFRVRLLLHYTIGMLQIFTSTVVDGSMKSLDANFASVLPSRTVFLEKHGIKPEDTTLVHLVYEGNDYTRFVTADDNLKGDGIVRPPSIVADGVATTEKNAALLLPLADCIGVVLHDSEREVLMLSHLGRHNLEQQGSTKSVEYMIEQFGCDPKNITVWLSPAAGKEHYPLYSFDGRGMHEVAIEQLLAAGILPENITASDIDVTINENYFSHSEFLKGNRKTDGRFAVVAIIR